MSTLHILRWTVLRIPLFRGFIVILLLTYSLLPSEVPGQDFLVYLSTGYVTGVSVIAAPAFFFFMLFLLLFVFSVSGRHERGEKPEMDYALLTNLTSLAAMGILILYLWGSLKEMNWALWITTIVSLLEIGTFFLRGKIEDKRNFFMSRILSSVVLYALVLFYLIGSDGDFGPMRGHYRLLYTGVILHMIAETLIFKFLEKRK